MAEIVALFVLVTRYVFRQPTYSLKLAAPNDLPGLDVRLISWDQDKCFISYGDAKTKIKPAGAGAKNFEIRLPPEITDKIRDTDVLDLELVDKKDNRWSTESFYLYTQTKDLISLEDREKIVKSYEAER